MAALAQATDFVAFEVCFLDVNAWPWEFRPSPRGQLFYVYPNPSVVVATIDFDYAGIDCVKICASNSCRFVEGSISDVMEKIRSVY